MVAVFSIMPLRGIVCSAEDNTDDVLIVGFDAEFPPYGYKDDNGEYVGFDLDLAQEVCNRNGWTLKKQPIEWNSKDMELNSGSIDCIWNGFTMNGREDSYTWSTPYIDNSQVVIVNKNSGIAKLEDLNGKIVAVQADSSALATLSGEDATQENLDLASSFKELQQVGDYNSAFMNLEAGAVDAICMDIGVANYEISSRGDKFVMLDDRLSSEKYAIGFKLGNTELRDQVQDALMDMVSDGTFTQIATEWGLEESVCLSAENTSNDTNTNLDTNADGIFTVGFDAEFPPYGYKDDNGEYVGFDLDLAQEVCNRNGWTLKKQPIEWNSKDMELNSGSIDCIWNGFTMNGREDSYTWSTPYIDNSQVVIVNKNSGIAKLEDLNGKIVAVQADSSALATLSGEDATQENLDLASSFKELQQVGDYNSAFMNLEAGAVDAICMDIGVANYEISSRGDKFVMLDDRLSSEKYAIGFKLGNTELRNQVQNALLEMLSDGTFDEIATKWNLQDSVCLSAEDTYLDESTSNVTTVSFGAKVLDISKQLSSGLLASLSIFVLTLIFSLPLGLLISAGRMCKIKPIQWIVKVYISIVRGTPLMLQLLVVFFGPYYLFGTNLSSSYRFYAVIIGFSLNYAAYFAEIYRSGIQAIPKGQYEACTILGYSKSQTFFKIVFPQMVKNIIPSVTNEVITLVKDTSLAFALSYTEMFTIAKQISASQTTIMPLFIAGVFYYIFNFIVAFAMEKLEDKLNYYR